MSELFTYICTKCGGEKSLPTKKGRHKSNRVCAECVRDGRRVRELGRSKMAETKARARERYLRLRSEVLASMAVRYNAQKGDSTIRRLLAQAKSRANREGLPFDIDETDLIPLPTHCPVYGIPLRQQDGLPGDNSFTIDKFVPAKGYAKGNVRVISFLANRHKSDATLEQLELQVASGRAFLASRTPQPRRLCHAA